MWQYIAFYIILEVICVNMVNQCGEGVRMRVGLYITGVQPRQFKLPVTE